MTPILFPPRQFLMINGTVWRSRTTEQRLQCTSMGSWTSNQRHRPREFHFDHGPVVDLLHWHRIDQSISVLQPRLAMEQPSDDQMETVTLPQPVRPVRTAIDTRPTLTTFVVESRTPTHFVVQLNGEGRSIRVPRATPTTTPRDAISAFLQGGAT